jgi:FtsH-binding integral membrane protein
MEQPVLYQNTNPMYYKDIEGQSEDVQSMLRLGFIRKVYGILSFQLILTVFMFGLTFVNPVREFYQKNVAIFWVCLGISILLIIPLLCCQGVARSVPTNYVFLTLWTICEGYMVATCCSFYSPDIVITAASLTCAITIALTFYAFTTKTDFTFMGGFLCVGSILMIFLGLFSIIFSFLNTLYCVLGVLLFSVYLIYDTQLVMGKYGAEYQIDDYIIAALMIYIDIIQIFLYLLQLLGKRDN